MADTVFSGCTSVTPVVESGSYAQTWCEENGLAYTLY